MIMDITPCSSMRGLLGTTRSFLKYLRRAVTCLHDAWGRWFNIGIQIGLWEGCELGGWPGATRSSGKRSEQHLALSAEETRNDYRNVSSSALMLWHWTMKTEGGKATTEFPASHDYSAKGPSKSFSVEGAHPETWLYSWLLDLERNHFMSTLAYLS